MKLNNLIPIVVILGVVILFFFPNPESNFLIYAGIALFFVGLVVFLLFKLKKKE